MLKQFWICAILYLIEVLSATIVVQKFNENHFCNMNRIMDIYKSAFGAVSEISLQVALLERGYALFDTTDNSVLAMTQIQRKALGPKILYEFHSLAVHVDFRGRGYAKGF